MSARLVHSVSGQREFGCFDELNVSVSLLCDVIKVARGVVKMARCTHDANDFCRRMEKNGLEELSVEDRNRVAQFLHMMVKNR